MITHKQPAETGLPVSVVSYDIETIAPEQPDRTFPPWPIHRPVAVGFARAERRDGQWLCTLAALVGREPDDPALVREADKRIGAAEVICGWNTRQFDSLVLRLSAQRRREWGLKALAGHASAKRYAVEHADLAEYYNNYGRKVALAEVCAELGVPVKTTAKGGNVAALWAAGDHGRIRRYVLEDAVATLIVFFCWSAARAGEEALVTRPLAALARHVEADADLAFLQPFVDAELTRWARPKAMAADIAAALGRVQRKLEREEVERSFVRSDPEPRPRR